MKISLTWTKQIQSQKEIVFEGNSASNLLLLSAKSFQFQQNKQISNKPLKSIFIKKKHVLWNHVGYYIQYPQHLYTIST